MKNNIESIDSQNIPGRKHNFIRDKQPIPVAEWGPEDGLDPKVEVRKRLAKARKDKIRYSSQRLGSQIEQTLIPEAASGLGPDQDDFYIARVLPSETGHQFIVLVACCRSDLIYQPAEIARQIKNLEGRLKASLAQTIHRKQIPDLVIEVLPPGVQP